MHTNLMIMIFKALREKLVFQLRSLDPQDLQGPQAVLAPRVHLVSIPFAKPGTHQMAP